MAALSNDQFSLLHTEGDTLRMSLYRIKGVTTGDTVDLAADFRLVQEAAFLCSTEFPGINPSLPSVTSNTVVTLAQTGLANDGGYLLVMGTHR
jgi:hypothetical protein